MQSLCAESAPQSASDKRYDGLVRLARAHFAVRAVLLTRLVEGQARVWACAGLSADEAWRLGHFGDPRSHGEGLTLVSDLQQDAAWRAQAAAAGVRFYAASPLLDDDGTALGLFCLLDDQPRDLDAAQRDALRQFACLAATAFEHDRVEASLRDSERRMALAIEGSGTGVWDRNVPAGEIYYSRGWKALLGYAEEDVSNRIEESYTRLHPDDLAYVKATMQAHLDQHTPFYQVEHRIRRKDGSYMWVSSRGKVVERDAEGRPLRMIGTTTDITELRGMSERLQQTVELLTGLTNEIPGMVFQFRRLADGSASFPYVSAGSREIYGLTPQQMANGAIEAIRALIHPDDMPRYLAALEASASSLMPWQLEYRVILPGQGVRWRQGSAHPQRQADGAVIWHGFITDITERKRIEVELQLLATTDFLTQLPNRRHFMQQLAAELARVQRASEPSAAILMCDLDHFKAINDRWGHAVGDQALKHFADILAGHIRRNDCAGRMGGEEFAVLLSDADLDKARVFAQRLQQRLADLPLLQDGERVPLTISIGITAMDARDSAVESVLSRSDMALYRAKQAGRNRIECG